MANENLPPLPTEPKGAVASISSLDLAAAQGPPALRDPKVKPTGAKTQEEQEAARTITAQNNPANDYETRMLRERGPRISLNAPDRKLEVPPIEGWHLHWFLERNIPKALAAWYEFVLPNEVPSANGSIGGRSPDAKSEDIGGARVAQIGGTNERGLPEQLILMKIKQEYYFDEQRKIAQRNLQIIQQVFHKKAPVMAPEESKTDYSMRYTREAVIDMSNGRFRKVEPSS